MKSARIIQIKPRWSAVLIFLLAAFARVYRLGAQALFFDEAHSWLTSQYPISDVLGILQRENHVPLYYLLLKIYLKLVPHTAFWLRSFSVVFSLFSLAVLMWLARRFWGWKAALFAGWLMAISSFEIYYAQETRMYTLLNFLWLMAVVLLLEAITRKPKLLIIWAVVLVLLAYVQATGLILAFVQSLLVGGIWVYGVYVKKRVGNREKDTAVSEKPTLISAAQMLAKNSRIVLLAGGLLLIGVLPLVWTLLFTQNWRGIGGGVWVPTLRDFGVLFKLAGGGITTEYGVFLDSQHLVLPILRSLPSWAWFLVAMVVGGLAIRGCVWGWRSTAENRMLISLLLSLIILPPMIVWLLGRLMNQPTWAYKSFLGAVLLFYLLAGVGYASLRSVWVRRSLVVLTFGIALLSLLPYYTVWQKADTKAAFADESQPYEDGYILLETTYLAPLVHFYQGRDAAVIGLVDFPESEKVFHEVRFGPGYMYGKEISCRQIRAENPEKIWIYGREDVIRQRLADRADCFGEAQIFIFQDGIWKPFEL